VIVVIVVDIHIQSDEILLNSLGISSTSTYIDSNDINNALNTIKLSNNNTKDKVIISYRLLQYIKHITSSSTTTSSSSSTTTSSSSNIESIILPCISTLLDIISYIISQSNDPVELFSKIGYLYGNQMIGRYLGQLLFIVCNKSSNVMKVTITPLIVK